MNVSEKIYCVSLGILAFFGALLMAATLFFKGLPSFAANAETERILKQWLYAEGFYVGAIVITLILRAIAPRLGKTASTVLNILLLPLVPMGTALGIYGLCRVDRRTATPELP